MTNKNDVRHTPGPWIVRDYKTSIGSLHIDSASDSIVEVLPDINGCTKSNATLIASAPELLEALKKIAMVCTDKYQADIIDKAIAKAAGRG